MAKPILDIQQDLSKHMTAHNTIIKGGKVDHSKDQFSIGLHLYNCHDLKRPNVDFLENVTFCIIDNPSPKVMDLREHLFIHRYKTLRPL